MLQDMVNNFCESINNTSVFQIENVAKLFSDTFQKNKRIFICGNGGSGVNAELFASEVTESTKNEKIKSSVISLNGSMSMISAIAEKEGYDKIFAAQLKSMAEDSDLLIAISGSGNSPNILEAAVYAKSIGMKTIALTGMGGGKLLPMADRHIVVDSYNMEQIESIHTILIHAISGYLKDSLNN